MCTEYRVTEHVLFAFSVSRYWVTEHEHRTGLQNWVIGSERRAIEYDTLAFTVSLHRVIAYAHHTGLWCCVIENDYWDIEFDGRWNICSIKKTLGLWR